MWRSFLEPYCVNTTQIGNKWDCGKSSAQNLEETSAVLFQSGLDEKWWEDSMECNCFLRNVTDLESDGKTPYERRFGRPFIPFGALVEYYHTYAKDQSRKHQFGNSLTWNIPWTRSVRGWNSEGWRTDRRHWGVAMDASEIYSKKTQCERSDISQKKKGEFTFPIADGRIQTLGGDQDLRTSTLIRDHPRKIFLRVNLDRGEEPGNLFGESQWSSPPLQDSVPDDGDARNDFLSMFGNYMYRRHVEPRVKLHVPREESFPISPRYIDVTRTISTTLDVMLGRRMDDYWNIEGNHSWTGFTRFTILGEKHPDGFSWSRWQLTKKQTTFMSDYSWPERWKDISEAWHRSKTELYLLHWSRRCRVQRNYPTWAEKSWKFRCQQQCFAKLWGIKCDETSRTLDAPKAKIRMHRWSRQINEQAFGRSSSKRDHEDHIAGQGTNSNGQRIGKTR